MGKKMETSRGKTSSRTSNKQTENTLGVMAGLVPFDRVRAKHFFFFLFFSLCVACDDGGKRTRRNSES
jgi:hypothetical protein